MDKELTPRLQSAANGKRHVYFADAAHFVHGSFLSSVWCLHRRFLPTSSGRSRYNVLGAIDAITHKLLSVRNTGYINAESVCNLLDTIHCSQVESSIPITVIMDNARYQHCELVTNKATQLKIELLFLPSYSPNLNIIERLWKWMKRQCLNCKYYATFADFMAAIIETLNSIEQEQINKELDTMLALNFQLFDSSNYNRV